MGDCTESHQIWGDTLGEQSRNQVGTTVPAAMGPCAPSEPVLHSSGFAVVQGKSCVHRAVTHGSDAAMSGGSCGKGTSPAHLARSQPGMGSQYAHVGCPRVELVSRATHISRKSVTSRRSSANPRRSKKLNEMRSASLLHNLRSATKPLNLFEGTRQLAQTKIFLVPFTSATISP